MDSPLSPVIADLFMRKLEVRALSLIRFLLPFYYRFIDAILLAIPASSLVPFLMFLILSILDFSSLWK